MEPTPSQRQVSLLESTSISGDQTVTVPFRGGNFKSARKSSPKKSVFWVAKHGGIVKITGVVYFQKMCHTGSSKYKMEN